MTAPVATDVIDLHVHGVAAGGDGVGRSEGLVVFVPRTARGDFARVRIDSVKRFARGSLEALLSPSPDRIDPPCAHYTEDHCGGCQLQHIRYDAQLEAKGGIVSEALARIARRPVDIPPTRPSERQWRYRNKLTLTMRRGADDWTMGLHPFDDPAAIFQLADCPITDERVVATWREIMQASALLPEARELRGTVRLADAEIIVLVKGGTRWPSIAAFFDAIPSASALWWTAAESRPRLVHERRSAPAGTSFGQVNEAVGEMLHRYVIERVVAHAPASVVDAYAGTGETATALASLGMKVTAIEIDREAASV
jgi:23S rRNA (uracil1939-C5)-methyltransferase